MPGSRSHTPASDIFVLLKENRFAHAAIKELLDGRASLVYLHGPSGSGKTHLLRHLLKEARKLQPKLKPVQISAAEFLSEWREFQDDRQPSSPAEKYLAADLIVLEDVADLATRPAAQRSLVSLIDGIKRAGGRILLTGPGMPGKLKGIIPRLSSRLRGGVCAGIEPIAAASRENLIRHLAASRQIPISREAAALVAEHGGSTPRELLAALVNLEMEARKSGEAIDASWAAAHLQRTRGGERPGLRSIVVAVAKSFAIPAARLRSTARDARSTLPRQVAMLLARELSGESSVRIAAFFGRRNHATVVHACRRTRALLADDPTLARQVDGLRRQLR